MKPVLFLTKHVPLQGFDGLALGTAFVKAKFSTARYITFACIFVMVTPIGIALGIGISQSYQPGSKAALGTEAAFNSISAGWPLPLSDRSEHSNCILPESFLVH